MRSKYVSKNAVERERLVACVSRLSDEDLSRPVGNRGWTVSGYMAHLAFRDQRAIVLPNKRKKDGVHASPIDVDVVNDTMRVFCIAVTPRTAARMAISAAEGINREIESLDSEAMARIEADSQTIRLDRSIHRRHHLAQIEQVFRLE
jgi:hypothetical protein